MTPLTWTATLLPAFQFCYTFHIHLPYSRNWEQLDPRASGGPKCVKTVSTRLFLVLDSELLTNQWTDCLES